jgi:hypothetical protein
MQRTIRNSDQQTRPKRSRLQPRSQSEPHHRRSRGSEEIQAAHIAEAIQYRSPDRDCDAGLPMARESIEAIFRPHFDREAAILSKAPVMQRRRIT